MASTRGIDLVDGPARTSAQMEADLRELIATVQNPHLRRLLAAVFGEGSPTWRGYRDAPAAKRYHQAYPPRPARALPDRRAGGQRDLGDRSPASTATSR